MNVTSMNGANARTPIATHDIGEEAAVAVATALSDPGPPANVVRHRQ